MACLLFSSFLTSSAHRRTRAGAARIYFPECHGAVFTDSLKTNNLLSLPNLSCFQTEIQSFGFCLFTTQVVEVVHLHCEWSVDLFILSQVTPPFKLWLPSMQQLYTRGHHSAVNAGTDLLVCMSHYHVKRVKPRDCPSVFTTCVTQGALTRAQTQTAEHTDSLKQDTLSLTSISAPQLWL